MKVQTFDDSEETFVNLSDWTITGFPFESYEDIESFTRTSIKLDSKTVLQSGPVVFHGEFEISQYQEIHDTYWDAEGWGKGFVFINGFNIGRHWPLAGPQITLYVPKELLKRGRNEIHVIEMLKFPANAKMNFVNGPIFINDVKRP